MRFDQNSKPQLLAIRHSKLSILPGLCYGQTEVPLAATYPIEKAKLRQELLDFRISSILSSPFLRCKQLAIDLDLGPVRCEEKLQEMNFGEWEARLWSEIPREESELWCTDCVGLAPPNGESFLELMHRVQVVLNGMSPPPARHSHLIVTHAGVIRALWHLLDGKPPLACLDGSVDHGKIFAWNPWPVFDL